MSIGYSILFVKGIGNSTKGPARRTSGAVTLRGAAESERAVPLSRGQVRYGDRLLQIDSLVRCTECVAAVSALGIREDAIPHVLRKAYVPVFLVIFRVDALFVKPSDGDQPTVCALISHANRVRPFLITEFRNTTGRTRREPDGFPLATALDRQGRCQPAAARGSEFRRS